MNSDPPSSVPAEVLAHYELGLEERRLTDPIGVLELVRTEELVLRHLPGPPGRVADVGGGPGVYASWLAGRGYEVDLVDPVPLHVEQARRRIAGEGKASAFRAHEGEAERLPLEDGAFDAVLVMGPLYHLPARGGRVRALAEARRVLAPGGVLFAVGISRFASVLDGLREGVLRNAGFRQMALRDLESGLHRNVSGDPRFFTTAFFHRPEELAGEVVDGGLDVVATYGIEGPGWLLSDLDKRWADAEGREEILLAARLLESEPRIQAASPHLMVVGRRPP